MRLRKATESEYALYARWRDIVFSIPFSGTRPTDEVLQARRMAAGKHFVVEKGQNRFVTTGSNLQLLEKMVSGIAPADADSFVFEKIELLPLRHN